MDKRTLTALEGSIAKWEAIVNGTGVDGGTDNCPLCKEFYNEADEDDEYTQCCKNCPVSIAVEGQDSCCGTPYEKWGEYHILHNRNLYTQRVVFDEKSKQLAQAEVDFLKSLLPAGAR